ncbi:S41 family peptidase [Siphonobacter sp. SORGH_AS_1065]|uniref:S41 family peptidase n=1 Tax=Siphonobacter sp. SORGH_AS_1065 TaxID=3041795 RepID=UPI002780C305|nr:S41 family peptidase [Siphonobacter sp. SORGH_AS_1065]MDQ1089868.1 carboxyl-terminal processing protease [Siphonobacter sp. SORGH_AS_1065]
MMKGYFFLLLIILKPTVLLAQKPASLPKHTALSTPELSFEVLWNTFQDHYAFFKVKEVNWHQAYRKYRPLVHAHTTEDSLFSICSAMLLPFRDGQVRLVNNQGKVFQGSRFIGKSSTLSPLKVFYPDYSILAQQGFQKEQSLGPMVHQQPWISYALSPKLAYVRVNRFFADSTADLKSDVKNLAHHLDTLFSKIAMAPGLIIDLRNTRGGQRAFAYEWVTRFISKQTVGLYRRDRQPGVNYEDLTPAETEFVEPGTAKPYSGPVALLTNPYTADAADVFTVIMNEVPQVLLIGENTLGNYSDPYWFRLPNGWNVSLSNQRYYNARMICYEGMGTPVDILVKNNNNSSTQDPVLMRAIQELMIRVSTDK